jgi:UPF0755 protein
MRRFFVSILMLLLLVGAVLFGAAVLYDRPGPLPGETAIVIPHGRLSLAVEALQREGALPAGDAGRYGFRLAALLTRAEGPIHAGELEFPAHASLRDLLHVLRTARPVQHELTIPEGLTAAQIALLVANGKALSGPAPVPPEGGILPETYAYELDTPRSVLVGRMQQAMRRKLAAIWDRRDSAAGLSSPSELLRLASIVERETAIPAERPMVARVFLNRLHLGMKLQSDPTVAYAASGGLGNLSRPLSRSDLALANPYNTYAAPGLPPGPICAPGAASLDAVAHPAAGDELYFVANGSGGHAFAAALSDHLRNVARLRALHAGTAPPQ